MKACIGILSILSLTVMFITANRPRWNELDGYNFDQYVTDFNIKTHGSMDYESRKDIFVSELNRVRLHNAKGLTWKEGINRFSAMTKNEKRAFLGRSKVFIGSRICMYTIILLLYIETLYLSVSTGGGRLTQAKVQSSI